MTEGQYFSISAGYARRETNAVKYQFTFLMSLQSLV
jgi:hypothetical protein